MLWKVVYIGIGNVILLVWWLKILVWVGISVGIILVAIVFIFYWLFIFFSVNGVGCKSLGIFFYVVSVGIFIGWFWFI